MTDGVSGARVAERQGKEVAELLKGERWYAMAPPWSGQFVLSGDEDPHVGRFVCCTDAALHMDEEDLERYRDDDPATRSEFIAHHDPATVLALYAEIERLRAEKHAAIEAYSEAEGAAAQKDAEIARLREALGFLLARFQGPDLHMGYTVERKAFVRVDKLEELAALAGEERGVEATREGRA